MREIHAECVRAGTSDGLRCTFSFLRAKLTKFVGIAELSVIDGDSSSVAGEERTFCFRAAMVAAELWSFLKRHPMAAPGYSVVMLLVSFSLLCRGTDAIVSRHPSFRRQRGRIHEGHTIDSLLLRHKRQGTGPSCKFSCIGYADGNYQSCLDCNVYVSCNDGVLVDNRPCNPGLVWNDNAVGHSGVNEMAQVTKRLQVNSKPGPRGR
ncbi:hypothetical protein LSAT2_027383 [Lamellibrachia satsuma]|nr:hypothetical protein LSAT2_027383 [Lamellibrachia satsuma]